MDLASSSDTESDMDTTAGPSSNSPISHHPAPLPEGETSDTDSTTTSTSDDESSDDDETEENQDNEENTGVDSWGWGDAHFQHELDPVPAVGQREEPDMPYSDPRIPMWQEEDRDFAGDILKEYPEVASLVAAQASHGPLEVDGVPQLSVFCDGSIEHSSFRGRKKGGYSVAFRDPFFGTSDFVAQANPASFLGEPSVREHIQTSYFEQQEGDDYEEPEGFAQVAEFTVLEYASETLSIGQAELGAIAQSLEVGITLQEEHQPETMNITIFTDSTTAVVLQ